MDYNVVHLGGRLTRDPELSYTDGGTAVVDIGLAVNSYRNGEEETSFFDVTVWGDQAENVSEYLSKGSPVLITGELKQDRWQNNGENRSKVKVVARNVQFVSGGSDESFDETPPGDGGGSDEDDEFSDIPF